MVVARLLLPSDYGLVGMAAIYINLFTLFSEFGIGTAVVTLQDLSEHQVAQLNTVSVLTGLLGFLISAAAAVPLGKFFRAPNLPLVVVVLSCGFVVSGVRTVPYSLLQKELRFKLLAIIEGMQGVVQAAVTLVLAFLGFGYWALVLGILSFSVTPTCLYCFGGSKASLFRDGRRFTGRFTTAVTFWWGDYHGRSTMIRTSSWRAGCWEKRRWECTH